MRKGFHFLAQFDVGVGALSGCGSACWFTGFAIAEVALVRAVGQVEIVFTLLFSRFYLKEILRRADVAGRAFPRSCSVCCSSYWATEDPASRVLPK